MSTLEITITIILVLTLFLILFLFFIKKYNYKYVGNSKSSNYLDTRDMMFTTTIGYELENSVMIQQIQSKQKLDKTIKNKEPGINKYKIINTI